MNLVRRIGISLSIFSFLSVLFTSCGGSVATTTVSNPANPSAPPPPAASGVKVLTYHNDVARTGLNDNETILTPANVNSSSFGVLGTLPVVGLVDAEPLYVPNLSINGAAHNVVFVVTEHDMVYAFDADSPGAPLWQVSAIPSSETPSDDRGCFQVQPEIGITATPVIDPATGTNGAIFFVTMSKDASGNYHQRLHALDLINHTEMDGGPTEIQASVSGSGTSSVNGTVSFNPGSYEERASLLLLNGTIYTEWTSHCDAPNYTSWVIAYTDSTLRQKSVLNLTANGSTQNGQEGGIWMAGSGPAADSSGFIYLLVGNGTFDTTLDADAFPNQSDYGNSFMKLNSSSGSLSVADYFAMNNAQGTAESESSQDEDLGSGGAMVLPDVKDASGNTVHLAVGAGKDQMLYVVNRDDMGKFAANDAAIYQEIPGVIGPVFSAPAFFNNVIYYGSVGSPLVALPVSSARVATNAAAASASAFGFPGTTPSISANGSVGGIVWAIENGAIGTLHAYDATNLATELYNSNQSGSRDQFADNSNDKFVTPMIANGKVYVGTPNAVVVFGLLAH